MTPERIQAIRWEKELEERNRPMTDDEIDLIVPGAKDGYEIVKAPENYKP